MQGLGRAGEDGRKVGGRQNGAGGGKGGWAMGRLAQGYDWARIWPNPVPSSPTSLLAAWVCTSDFGSTDPSSPIWVTQGKGTYFPFPWVALQPVQTLCWILHRPAGLSVPIQDRIGLPNTAYHNASTEIRQTIWEARSTSLNLKKNLHLVMKQQPNKQSVYFP